MTMAVLEVGRLHARYDAVAGPDGTATLDDALRRVAEQGLAAELVANPLPDAHAVCVRDLALHVDLDPTRPVDALARRWAAAIVASLEDRLAAGDGVVVYEREVDAVVDLVRSVAAGDRSRTWAWHQIGLVDRAVPWPTAVDVAGVLAARPALVPATVLGSAPALERVLDPAGWVLLALAVHRVVGRSASVPSAPVGTPEPEGGVVATAAVVVPEAVWTAVTSAEDRRALAVLALACVAPARSRDARTIDAVLAAAVEDGDALPARAMTSTPDAAETTTPAGAPTAPDEEREADLPWSIAEPAPATEAELVVSGVGGVLFLVHAVTALDLPPVLLHSPLGARDTVEVLARVLAAAAGVDPNDAAVLAAAGWRGTVPTDVLREPLPPALEALVEEHAEQVRAWVADRLGEDAADVGWVWARRATVDARPGWVEATFSLDGVDLRLRIAGLDLDPGPVWWLGGVVRFRYV